MFMTTVRGIMIRVQIATTLMIGEVATGIVQATTTDVAMTIAEETKMQPDSQGSGFFVQDEHKW